MTTRQIEKKMVEYIDEKLALNGSAQDAMKSEDARLVFVFAMESLVGVREVGGNNRGPLVKLIQETVGGAQGENWCMSTIQTCLAYAEKKTGKASRFPVTERCLTAWEQAPDDLRVVSFPKRGAVAIFKHVKSTTGAGHTEMFVEGDGATMLCVGGNTNQGVDENDKIVSDGGGVYLTRRSMKPVGEMRLIGFLKPF